MALVTAPLGRGDTFRYQPLADGEIRIVTFEKLESPADGLTCTIGHVSIDTLAFSRPFTAVSYVWGDGQDATKLGIRDDVSRKSGDITVTCRYATSVCIVSLRLFLAEVLLLRSRAWKDTMYLVDSEYRPE